MITNIPRPPYYAVIFTSERTTGDNGYSEMADEMELLVNKQKGFLGFESARESSIGITVSYWKDLQSIRQWKVNHKHKEAREKGRSIWYKSFKVRIAKIERDYGIEKL